MTNLIVTRQDIKVMENLPIYQIHSAFDDYPFPYDDAARVIVPFQRYDRAFVPLMVIVMPSGETGSLVSPNGKNTGTWERYENGYYIKPFAYESEIAPESFGEYTEIFAYYIHCAVTALRMVSAFNLPRVEAQKRDVKRATKGLKPETKTDKYYILKLSGRSLDYLPEPQGKCQATGIKHRWHMCRGHYRHLKSGKVIFVKGHYRGDKALGIVHKDYAL